MRALKQSEVRAPGNPSEKADFFIGSKTNEVFDFIRFAHTLPRHLCADEFALPSRRDSDGKLRSAGRSE